MTRRRLLRSLLGTAAAAAYPCGFEPFWMEQAERSITLKRSGLTHPIRILHLSDLHASFVVPMSLIERAVKLGIESKPDVVCLTGDFIRYRGDFDFPRYVHVLKQLAGVAPAYAVLGNHDGGVWARESWGYSDHRVVEHLLDESGIELLHNRSIHLHIRNDGLSLVGVGDLWSDEIEAAPAFAGVDQSRPIILLSHNPDSKDILGAHPWDLMLSGHTHGGQIIVPLAGAPFAPVEDKRYLAGLKPWGARQIHVTRGGGSLGGVRFRCRPEVSLLQIS